MIRFLTAVCFLVLTGACTQDQPFDFSDTGSTDSGSDTNTDTDTGTDTTDGTGGSTGDEGDGDTGGIDSGTGLPPGTAEPTRDEGIVRFEADDDNSGGLVRDLSYNADGTFTVDNLAFDGANIYTQDNQVPVINGYAVFEADVVTLDSLTGQPIGQIRPYRALFGTSTNRTGDEEPRTSFAIVRTGGFGGYGFGGFLYERNGGVVIPESQQAGFTGQYAGVRVFSDRGGLEYTRGNVAMAIDFEDFNSNAGVAIYVTDRTATTIDNVDITLGGHRKPCVARPKPCDRSG